MKLSVPMQRTLLFATIAILTFICFRYTLHNQFTLWDDDFYVTNDPYIRALTPHNLKVIFTEDITRNNYHPFCMLSLAFNYLFSGLEPMSYYFTNIAIHAINGILVAIFFMTLAVRLGVNKQGGLLMGAIGGILFAIHPMHVESVAWIAERKDVLYTFFYLLGLLAYIKHLEGRPGKWLLITFLLAVASALSKPMAVVFPLSLLCLDVLYGRCPSVKMVVSKWPFFLASLFFGFLAFYTQNANGAVTSFSTLTIGERFMYASYGFVMYIAKFFVPFKLSTFYPYPYRYINGSLPMIYYLAPVLSVIIVVVPAWLLYRVKSRYFVPFLFGIGFFVANIIFVLQFISVGAAIMADHYSYVAYIGLLFLLAYFIQQLVERIPASRLVALPLVAVYMLGLSVVCAARTHVWHDSETLFTDAIEKYPYQALLSYKWRGHYYFSIGEYDKAMKDYNLLLTLHSEDKKVLRNIAQIKATQMILAAPAQPAGGVDISPRLDSISAYVAKKDTLLAFKQYLHALKEGGPVAETRVAKIADSLVQAGAWSAARDYYNMLIKINTTNPYYYFLRGCAYFGDGSMKAAIADWERGLGMQSKDVQQSCAYNLSVAYDSLKQPNKAYEYIERAIALGYKPNAEFVQKLKTRAKK